MLGLLTSPPDRAAGTFLSGFDGYSVAAAVTAHRSLWHQRGRYAGRRVSPRLKNPDPQVPQKDLARAEA